jgi:hypothetical protein
MRSMVDGGQGALGHSSRAPPSARSARHLSRGAEEEPALGHEAQPAHQRSLVSGSGQDRIWSRNCSVMAAASASPEMT